MSQRNVIITTGLIIALMPALGFPQEVDNVVYIAGGLVIMIFEYFSPLVYCAQCKKLVVAESKEEEKQPEKTEKKPRKLRKKPVSESSVGEEAEIVSVETTTSEQEEDMSRI